MFSSGDSVTLSIPEDVRKDIQAQGTGYTRFAALARACRVSSPAELEQATELYRAAREKERAIDAVRTSITKPMLEAKRNADEFFAGALKPLRDGMAVLKMKIDQYGAENQARRVEQMRTAAAALASGTIPTAIVEAPAQVEGVSLRQEWAFEVTDPALVERGLCSPDPEKIAHVLKAYQPHETPHPIPGVRVFLRGKSVIR